MQQIDQPGHARVLVEPRLAFDLGLGKQGLPPAKRRVQFRHGQRAGDQFAFGKALDRGAGIAQKHPARAVPVQQFIDQGRAFLRIGRAACWRLIRQITF